LRDDDDEEDKDSAAANSARQPPRAAFNNDDIIIINNIQRVEALADISRSALRCHSNETRTPILNPPNSAQLGKTPYY